MGNRRWKEWPKRFCSALNSTGGVVGAVGLGLSALGATVSAPIVLTFGGVTLGGALIYAVWQGIPPNCYSAPYHVGRSFRLEDLPQFYPPLLKLGIVGISKSGKSTFLQHARQQRPTDTRTNKICAVVITLQTTPPSFVALLDGDGQQLSQQFVIAANCDFLLVFLDHNEGDSAVAKSKERVEEHERFLQQLAFHLKERSHLRNIHFLLNKRDLWERSRSAEELRAWLENHVTAWRNTSLAETITSDSHSNTFAEDITKVLSKISDQAKLTCRRNKN